MTHKGLPQARRGLVVPGPEGREAFAGQLARMTHRRLLGAAGVRSILGREFGFDLTDIEQVSEAIVQRYQHSLGPIWDLVEAIQAKSILQKSWSAEDHNWLSKAYEEATRISVASTPFRSADLVEYSAVDLDRIEKILDAFSRPLLRASAADEITKFVHGIQSLSEVGALRDAKGTFTILNSGIKAEMIRPRLEATLRKSPKVWQSYGRQRDRLVEKMAGEHLSQLFGAGAPSHQSLKYLAPNVGSGVRALAKDAVNPKQSGQAVESDGLILVDDVAICLEVKAGALSAKARTGNVQRVTQDRDSGVKTGSGWTFLLSVRFTPWWCAWRTLGRWLLPLTRWYEEGS